MHLFLATELEKREASPDADESLEIVELSWEQALALEPGTDRPRRQDHRGPVLPDTTPALHEHRTPLKRAFLGAAAGISAGLALVVRSTLRAPVFDSRPGAAAPWLVSSLPPLLLVLTVVVVSGVLGAHLGRRGREDLLDSVSPLRSRGRDLFSGCFRRRPFSRGVRGTVSRSPARHRPRASRFRGSRGGFPRWPSPEGPCSSPPSPSISPSAPGFPRG